MDCTHDTVKSIRHITNVYKNPDLIWYRDEYVCDSCGDSTTFPWRKGIKVQVILNFPHGEIRYTDQMGDGAQPISFH